MAKNPSFTTPAARSLYPKLQEPDTKFKPEGEYSVKLLMNEVQAATIVAQVREAQEQAFQEEFEKQQAAKPKMKPEKIREGIKRADLPAKPYEDPETGEETGEWVITFKTKASGIKKNGEPWERKVPLFDAKAQPIMGKLPEMWSGSVLRVSYTVDPFCTAIGAGCTLRIQAVQIIELRTGGAGSAEDHGFAEEEDGYSYTPGGDGGSPFGPTSTSTDAATGDNADDGDDGQGDF